MRPSASSAWAQARPQTPRIRFPIAVYSHRGGPLEGFEENTLPAFRNSARLGVDLLELDVQMTRDGQVVVFHDRYGSGGGGRRAGDTEGGDRWQPSVLLPEIRECDDNNNWGCGSQCHGYPPLSVRPHASVPHPVSFSCRPAIESSAGYLGQLIEAGGWPTCSTTSCPPSGPAQVNGGGECREPRT